MNDVKIFHKAEKYLNEKLPFVIYRKACPQEEINFSIKGFFQEDDKIHTIKDFTESGFVIAPFDFKNPTIIIPSNKAEKLNENVSLSGKIDLAPPIMGEDEVAKKHHINLVLKGIEVIKKHQLQKVVLSRKFEVPTQRHPIAIFQRLLQYYPTAFVYCWYHPKVGLWLGATPETLLKTSGQNLETMALAGTKSALENAKPQWTPKEIEEQQLVTDFIKKTLEGKVTDLSVGKVVNIRAGNLWHLKCDVYGRLEHKENLKQILEEFHPTPAVCGVPKEAAKRFILEHENYNREFYTGFIGELNMKKEKYQTAESQRFENTTNKDRSENTEFFVNLRCMQIDKNACQVYVGGGIVADSQPESEWKETVNKSRTMLDVL